MNLDHITFREQIILMEYRLATLEDIPEMCRLRTLQLIDEGEDEPVDVTAEMADFFRRKMEDGSFIQWLLEDGGRIVATAGILYIEFTPGFHCRDGVRGYITDMYTAPEYRRRGIATHMLGMLRDDAVSRKVRRIMLGASVHGMPVYRKFGFRDIDDWMYMDLDDLID